MEFFKAMISERRDLAEEIAEANAEAGNIRMAKGLLEYIPGPVCACTSCYNSLTLLKVSQSYECPRHNVCSLESRIARAFHVACNWGVPDVFVSLLQPEWQENARSVCETSSAVFPLISMVALRIGDESRRSCDASEYKCLVSWSTLAEDIIRNSSDLHIICPTLKMTCKFEADFTIDSMSPLVTVVTSGVQTTYSSLQDFFEDRIGLLSIWLHLCANAGVNLFEYGRREMNMLLEDGATCHACSPEIVGNEGSAQKVKVCLTGFKYGDTSKDWDILWSETTVPPFSGLQATSRYNIPGAWVEDKCV